MPDASEIHKSFLLFFCDFGAAVCTPVEPKTFVIAACCAATGLVFGATACGRVRPAEASTVAPEAAAASAAVLKVFVLDLSATSGCSAAAERAVTSTCANSSPVWKRLLR